MVRGVTGLVFIPLLAVITLFGCATSPKASPEDTGGMSVGISGSPQVTPVAVDQGGGTMLAVPSKEQLKKNNLDSKTLALIQGGAPNSIREAVRRINDDPRGMTDQNRSALALAGELIKILYPMEAVSWPIPSVPEGDKYLSIIRSARMGAYDYSANDGDFLSLVLPSLVLAVSPAPAEYHADARAALEKAADMNDTSVLPPLLLGMLAERQERLPLSEEYYRKAWTLDDSCYPAGVALARSLIRKGKGSEALSVSKRLSERYPSSIAMTRLCAESAFAMQDWAAADGYILEVLKAEPSNAGFLLLRARILVERKEYLKANSLLDAFATTSRTDKYYLLLRARVSREWNRNPVAATSFLQDANRLYPDDRDVLLATAEIAYQTGQTINQKTGRELVKSVLAAEPDNKAALSLLMNDYLTSADWSQAVRLGEQLVSIDPVESARVRLVQAYLGAGNASRAVSLARTLYASGSPSDEVTSLYLRALTETGDLGTATSVIQARMPGSSSGLKSVLHYYESKLLSDPDARLSVLRSSLLADPRNGLALFAMYEWHFERADYRKAQYYLKQVIALEPANKKYTQLLSNLDDLLAR